MTTNKPQEILFVTNNGLTKDSGYSLNLSRGQFAIVDVDAKPTAKGAKVVDTFSTNKENKYELRLGVKDLVSRSMTNRPYASLPFKLSDIKSIKATAPSFVNTLDEFILGFDGFDADSALTLKNGETLTVEIKLKGEGIGLNDYYDSEAVFNLVLDAPNEGAFTMQELVEKAIITFNSDTKLEGDVSISEVVEVTPVNSENPASLTGDKYTFQTLTVKDAGEDKDRARVQAQYNDYDVKIKTFDGETTEYVVMTPELTTLADYNEYDVDITLDCEEYDESTLKVVKTTKWVVGETCTASKETYEITLPDTVCGTDREAELSAAFPELTIVKGESKACQTRYSAEVITNVVCEECSPIFRDIFESHAPGDYLYTSWTKAPKTYSETALMGIRIKGKRTLFALEDSVYPKTPTFNDFIRVSVAAYTTSNNYLNFDERYNYIIPKVLSLGSKPESLGLDYKIRENEAFVYYNAIPKENGSFANMMLGSESLLKPLSQYVMYSVEIGVTSYSQSVSQTHTDNVKYDIIAEVGRHKSLEAGINKLATAAGLPTVQTYGGK